MTQERDDLEDKPMSDLLHRWGKQVRIPCGRGDLEELRDGSRLFPPPGDRSALRRALRAVDEEVPREGAPAGNHNLAYRRLLRRAAVIAASATVLLGSWWLVEAWRAGPVSPTASEIRLSVRNVLLRGETEREFRSGDLVYLHLTLDRPGIAFVAMLDSHLQFVPLSSEARVVGEGPNILGPFRLDDQSGKEAFVILTSASPRGAEEFRKVIVSAVPLNGAGSPTHEEKLELLLKALSRLKGFSAGKATFEHLPR